MQFDPLNEIPDVGTLVPEVMSVANHPDYTANLATWQFLRHAHEMSGGFAPYVKSFTTSTGPETFAETYLIPHEKEDALDLRRRVAHATPPRFVRDGITTLAGILMQQAARRDQYPEQLIDWQSAVTADREPWETWETVELIPLLLRYGHVYVLPHRPAVSATNAAEFDEAGAPPCVLSTVTPEALRAWEIDDLGAMTWARYVETLTGLGGPFGASGTTTTRHWWITRLGWFAVDVVSGADAAATEVVTSGYWLDSRRAMSRVPIVCWEMPGRVGPTHIAATKALQYFRTESDLRKLETATAFSQTWVPVMSNAENPAAVVKGPDVVGGFPADSKHTPLVLSPDSAPLQHFRERLDSLASEAMEAYGLGQPPSGAATGVALAHAETKSINLCRLIAQSLAKGEAETMATVSEILGIAWADDMRPVYPKEFGALASTKVLDNVTTFVDLGCGDHYRKLAIQAAASALLPDLSAEDKRLGADGIDEAREKEEEQREELADQWAEKPAAPTAARLPEESPEQMAAPGR